jgi:hypothetical protein
MDFYAFQGQLEEKARALREVKVKDVSSSGTL